MFVLLFSAANRTRPSAPVHGKFHCARCAKSNFYRFQRKRTKGPRAVNGRALFCETWDTAFIKGVWRASAALPCRFWALGRWSDGGWAEQGQRVPWPGSCPGCHLTKSLHDPHTLMRDLDPSWSYILRSWYFHHHPCRVLQDNRILIFNEKRFGTVDGLPIHGMALVCLPLLEVCGGPLTGDWLRVIDHRKGGLANNTEFVGIYCGYNWGYNGNIMGISIW